MLVPYPLVRHLLDAAAVASYLWDAYLSENQRRHIAVAFGSARDMDHARALTALCAGLHDIGKLSGFAFCDARGRAGLSDELLGDKGQIGAEARPHEVVGMESIPAVLEALGFEDEEVVEWLAQIVGDHHGQFTASMRTGPATRRTERVWVGLPGRGSGSRTVVPRSTSWGGRRHRSLGARARRQRVC
ncbi:CRISPR-associated endonuclease Cas3'' [Streptomyces reniochalinae]|uniref:CRISPR-associated endonuclease Cas3 n=1 Tax=Streptomyces reniochalinae TaxID=2250578 RepID=A0A367E8W8_9ACTN|nr:CRISPR-associated endonuclease Cas3'' [Streptomyces reniochalinae]